VPKPIRHVFVCIQSRPPGHPRGSCGEKGCIPVFQTFLREFEARHLYGQFALTGTGCLGACEAGATVLVYPDGILYARVKPEDVAAIIEQHLLQQRPVEQLIAPAEVWG